MRFLALCIIGAAATAPPRPNIVWIMADDLGWGEPNAFPSTSEHGRISTPHLDDFAAGGLVFTDAYAGYTVCAPSRTTLMTGRHSGQFYKYGLSGTDLQSNFTTAMMLKNAGYATAAVGKTAPLHWPLYQGFDYFTGQLDQGLCHNMYPRLIDSGLCPGDKFPCMNVNMTLNWKEKNRTLCMGEPSAYNYTVDVFQSHALEWLDSAMPNARATDSAERTPFFLYLSFTVPHAGGWGSAPEQPEQGQPVPTDGQYASKDWPEVERDHAAVITYLDAKVGEVLAKLKEGGVEENTVVFFASDNGAHKEGGHDVHFFNSTGGLLGQKRSLYEGGVRSPTMVRWPGTIQPGRSGYAWAFWDVQPTLAELSGGQPTSDIDGTSIVPTLMGREQPDKEYLFWTWSGTGVPEPHGTAAAAAAVPQKSANRGYGVRQGEWKGVVPTCNATSAAGIAVPSLADTMALYHLPNDPFETTDVSAAHPDVVKKLKAVVVSKNLTCQCYQC